MHDHKEKIDGKVALLNLDHFKTFDRVDNIGGCFVSGSVRPFACGSASCISFVPLLPLQLCLKLGKEWSPLFSAITPRSHL